MFLSFLDNLFFFCHGHLKCAPSTLEHLGCYFFRYFLFFWQQILSLEHVFFYFIWIYLTPLSKLRHVSHAMLSLPFCCARPMFRLPMCLPSSDRGVVVFHILFVSFRKNRVRSRYVRVSHSFLNQNKQVRFDDPNSSLCFTRTDRKARISPIYSTHVHKERQTAKKENLWSCKAQAFLAIPMAGTDADEPSRHSPPDRLHEVVSSTTVHRASTALRFARRRRLIGQRASFRLPTLNA